MKVEVDLDLCQGHAMCELEAPEVFQVPKNSKVELLTQHPGEPSYGDVRRAVRECPTQALLLAE